MSDRGRLIVRGVFLGAFALVAGIAVIAIAILTQGDDDPLDRFEAKQSIAGADGRRAVIYRHHHANSSNEAWAVWLIDGSGVNQDTPARPRGEPAVVWFGKVEDLDIAWSVAERRFGLVIGAPLEARKTAHPTGCYFDYDSLMPCYDPDRVALVSR